MPSPFSFLSNLLGRKKDSPTSKPKGKSQNDQQALLVYLRFSDEESGTESERERVFRLEDEVIAAVEESGAGEFDGNEIGGGFFTLYMYGPSALELWEAVAPLLRRFQASAGSYAIRRYGKPGADQDRVDLLPQA